MTPATDDQDALIGRARELPAGPATPFTSTRPVVVPTPGRRPVELHVRVSAPTTGHDLPLVLLSHGGGTTNYLSSLRGLSPLADFWAAHGFVVVQPTHLSSPSLGLPPLAPDSRAFWHSRVEDLTSILDQLDLIERAVPGLAGRIARDRVAVAGHSMGGQTASMLLGAHFVDDDGTTVRPFDGRVSAGVLLAPTGAGGGHLTEAAARYTCLRTAGFERMTTPTLTVVGDRDDSVALTSRGPTYHADPYVMSPGPKDLLTLVGVEHMLGGITGYDAVATTDEEPERVAVVQRLSTAYLQSALDVADAAWPDAREAFAGLGELGRVESRGA